MVVNPMQRKANNSFLLGILVTLLITGSIIAFLLLQLSKMNKEKQENQARKVYAYMITEQVKSGTEIQSSQVTGVELNGGTTSDNIYSSKITGEDGKETSDSTGKNFPTGLKAKINLNPGTVVTSDLTYENELVAQDVRKQEYNVIALPTQIQTGDYIDIRLRLPNGLDYIVVAHKEVTVPTISDIASDSCIWVDLSEVETLNMSAAIVEAFRMNGAKLYANRYVEAGMQSATVTYLPSDEIIALMEKDPNALQQAKNELFARTRTEKSLIRNPINKAVQNEDSDDNLMDKVQTEIQGLQEEREQYLESLGL